MSTKYEYQLLDTATKTRLDALKTASKKVLYKAVKATDKFIGKKVADKTVKPKPVPAGYLRYVKEIISEEMR